VQLAFSFLFCTPFLLSFLYLFFLLSHHPLFLPPQVLIVHKQEQMSQHEVVGVSEKIVDTTTTNGHHSDYTNRDELDDDADSKARELRRAKFSNL
jgi:hypothetical protein